MNAPARLVLTEAEAAHELRVCARTLRNARKTGKLRYILIGNRVRYTMDDLADFIALSRQVMPEKQPEKPPRGRKGRVGNIVPFSARVSI